MGGKVTDRNVVPIGARPRARLVIPVRVVALVSREISPFAAVLVIEAVAAFRGSTGTAGRSFGQRPVDRGGEGPQGVSLPRVA